METSQFLQSQSTCRAWSHYASYPREEVLRRFERVELLHEPERTLSSFVKGYTYMPVEITRK